MASVDGGSDHLHYVLPDDDDLRTGVDNAGFRDLVADLEVNLPQGSELAGSRKPAG